MFSDSEINAYRVQRESMVHSQLLGRDISDRRVLAAMQKVPRHLFVPKELLTFAYSDAPLPIGENQTISQPYIVALMTQLLKLNGNEKVLEIGTGCGYQTAILAELCKEVYSMEIIPELQSKANETLNELGYKNIKLKTGDGSLGWPEAGPFDAILAACAPEHIPPALMDQLAEAGRMIIPVGIFYQELRLVTKSSGQLHEESIIPVSFVPMTGSHF